MSAIGGKADIAGLGKHAGRLRVVLLDLPRRRIDLAADILGLGPVQQVVEARLGGQIKDAIGVVGGGFLHAAAAA